MFNHYVLSVGIMWGLRAAAWQNVGLDLRRAWLILRWVTVAGLSRVRTDCEPQAQDITS